MINLDYSANKRMWPPVQTIAIAGAKGGIGKSVIAVNLAAALTVCEREVLLVDGDLEMGSVDKLLKLTSLYILSDFCSGSSVLSGTLLQGPEGITVVPSSNGTPEMANISQFQHASLVGLFSELPTAADTMIVDVAPGLSESVLGFCKAAREVLVVVTDEPTAMRDAYSTIKVLNEKCRVNRFWIVANMTRSPCHGKQVFQSLLHLVDQSVDVLLDYCGSIPFDPLLKLAVCQQQSVVEAYPCSPSALAFRKLGERVARWPEPQIPCGHIEFFVERLIQPSISTR